MNTNMNVTFSSKCWNGHDHKEYYNSSLVEFTSPFVIFNVFAAQMQPNSNYMKLSSCWYIVKSKLFKKYFVKHGQVTGLIFLDNLGNFISYVIDHKVYMNTRKLNHFIFTESDHELALQTCLLLNENIRCTRFSRLFPHKKKYFRY